MRRVCVVITARPSYARIKSVLDALMLRHERDIYLQVVAAASACVTRFGNVADHLVAIEYPVVARISSVVEDDTLANSALSTGLLTVQLAGTFERLKPDVVVTIADRHETLATATAAAYQHIPLCHVQGGEVTGSIDDKVRNAITQLADVHCVATADAARRVDRLTRHQSSQIYRTGCPSIDIAAEALKLGPLPSKPVIVLQHPVTNEVEQAADQMRATVEAVGTDALYFWPGEDAGGNAMSKVLRLAGIQPVRNMEPLEFLRTLLGAKVLVGNSSVGIRECSFLGVPVVNVGTRQNGRERGGNVTDVAHNVSAIRKAVEGYQLWPIPICSTLYGDGHAGERIADVLTLGHMRRAAA